jgi:hypothetical protein
MTAKYPSPSTLSCTAYVYFRVAIRTEQKAGGMRRAARKAGQFSRAAPALAENMTV